MRAEAFISDRALFDSLNGEPAEVCGVFSGGIYLSSPLGLLMLHDKSCGSIPFGIGVEGIKGKGHELCIDVGDRVILSRSGIDSGSLELRVQYSPPVYLPASREKLICFEHIAGAFLDGCERASLSVYRRFAPLTVRKSDIDDIFVAAAYSGMEAMYLALRENDAAALSSALERLIGLGRGLTPSCDDFLTGLLFTLSYAEDRLGLALPCSRALKKCVLSLAERKTNIYSAAYLKSAAEGGDFSLLRLCLEAPSEKNVSAAADIGSSSGTDMLCGMCYACGMIDKLAEAE